MSKTVISALTRFMMLMTTIVSAQDIKEKEIREKGFHFNIITPLGTKFPVVTSRYPVVKMILGIYRTYSTFAAINKFNKKEI